MMYQFDGPRSTISDEPSRSIQVSSRHGVIMIGKGPGW